MLNGKIFPEKVNNMAEITRPPGKTTIAPNVLLTIARLATLEVDGVYSMSEMPGGVNRIFQRDYEQGVRIRIEEDLVYVDLYVILQSDVNVRDVSRNIQQEVFRAISELVGMEVGRINVHIDDIKYPGNITSEADSE
jgi:uncharacterized alkaline shock family protein YloU